jgi:hypothetical protein
VGIHQEQVDHNYGSHDRILDSGVSDDTQALKDIVERERFLSFINHHELDTMKADIRRLMQIVRNQLAGNSWEIGNTSSVMYVIIGAYIIAGQKLAKCSTFV